MIEGKDKGIQFVVLQIIFSVKGDLLFISASGGLFLLGEEINIIKLKEGSIVIRIEGIS